MASLCWAQSQPTTQVRSHNKALLEMLDMLGRNGCIEDVPAPRLLAEPRFTRGTSNRICYQLPDITSLPFPIEQIKDPFVITTATGGNGELLRFPRPVDLKTDSSQFELMNSLDEGVEYVYSSALFLPVCKVNCDAVVDSSQLELHCSPYADTVRSIQDSQAPLVSDVYIPQLNSTEIAGWWNHSRFTVSANLLDQAGIWQAFLYTRKCGETGWQNPVSDTTFPGTETDLGYEFANQASVDFTQNLPDGCYDFRIEGKDASHTPESCFPDFVLAGNGGEPADTAAAQIKIYIDTTPPDTVALQCQQIGNSMVLEWTPSADNPGIGLAGYSILRDGEVIVTVRDTVKYEDKFARNTSDRKIEYQVQPFDSLGNVQVLGGKSTCQFNEFELITLLPEPRYTPGDTNLVCWRRNDQVDSYTVFIAAHDGTSAFDSVVTGDTCYTFRDLQDGRSYSFWVKAEDRANRIVTSDTVSSIQDASFPQITEFEIKNKITLNDRDWVASRGLSINLSAGDAAPGRLSELQILENGVPGLVSSLNPGISQLDTTLTYNLSGTVCESTELVARVLDAAGNPSIDQQVTLHLDDTRPESVSEFECKQLADTNGIELTWSPSTDPGRCSGLAGYFLLREGVAIDTVGPDTLRYADLFSDDTPSRRFTYQVQPFDSVGNVQTEGGVASCDYVGTSMISISELPEFTAGLSNTVCWNITGNLAAITVFVDIDCDSAADDSVVIANPESSPMCHTFSDLLDGQEYCYWISGVDFQRREVISDVVKSIQDDSAPVIDEFDFPAGEALNGQLWAYSQEIELRLVAHDLHNGEIWDYIIQENGQPEQRFSFPDSLSRFDGSISYELQTSGTQPSRVELAIRVADGAGNESQVRMLEIFLQEDLPNIFAFPNPFNPLQGPVTIRFENPDETQVNIYDFFGNLVVRLDENDKENSRDFVWDGRNGRGQPVANGGYICVGTKTKARFKLGVVKRND